MPNLPTINVTDQQADRILAAYKERFGTVTTPETVAAFQAWLTASVVDVVLTFEARRLDRAANEQKREALATLAAELPQVT